MAGIDRRRHNHTMCRLLPLLALLLLPPLAVGGTVPLTLQLKWKHQFQFAGYYAAVEKGYYREAGFDVRIAEAREGEDPVETVTLGKADFGVGASELLLQRARGRDVVVLAVILQHSPLVLLARQRVADSIHALAGKRIMLLPHESELFAYLQQEGIGRERIVAVPHSFDPGDLISGKVDAISAYATDEPFLFMQQGVAYSVFSPRASGIDFYGDNLFTSGRLLRERPETARAFQDASLRGWQYAMGHPEEIADLILARYSRRHSREHLLFEAAEMRRLMQPDLVEIGHMNPGRWRRIAETYAELGMLRADFPVEELLNDPAARRLPPWLVPAVAGIALLALAFGMSTLRFVRLNRRLGVEMAERRRAEADTQAANAMLKAQLDEISQLQEVLKGQASRDALTELFNRRYFNETLEREISRARREHHPLSLVMIDVDHFKAFNDAYGHQAGDELLRALGTQLRLDTRVEDVPCRWGGEEFIVLLPNMPLEMACERAESWRARFAALSVRHEGQVLSTTISIGVAAFPQHGPAAQDAIRSADRALYLAKAGGRNRVVVAEAGSVA